MTGATVTHAQNAPALRQRVAGAVATGLVHPWAVAFLPGGQFLMTEAPGRLRVVSATGQVGPALAGVPPVAAGGQGGLLDVVTDNDFAAPPYLLLFCQARRWWRQATSTAVARTPNRQMPADCRICVIFSQRPKGGGALQL